MFYCTNDYYVGGVVMRLTDKNKIKELATLEKNKVLMTDADYKELKLGQLEDILEKYNIDTNDELEVLCKYAEDVKHWMSIHEEKMLEIKRIEEELGIDLITLFKAQTQGFYIINVLNEIEKVKLSEWRFNLIKKEVHRIKWNKHLSFTDYGKTWALTKEELENE